MARLLSLLIMLLLPLQFTWAAVGKYCQHESSPAAYHFGHHAHVHKAESNKSESGKADVKTSIDSDCGFCHSGAPVAAIAQVPMVAGLPVADGFAPYISGPPPLAPVRTPDRPQWLRLA